MDKTDLVVSMVKILADNLWCPVTCKIWCLSNENDTLELVKKIEAAGCSILTVHGRIKEHKKHFIGPANWEIIWKIKAELKIPVFANGGIRTMKDYEKCMELTGVDGVMTSEAILENAAFFNDVPVHLEDQCLEYLTLAETYNEKLAVIKQHVFKFLHTGLMVYPDFRKEIGETREIDKLKEIA